MKAYKWLIVGLGALFFTSCERDLNCDMDDVNVTVATNDQVRYEGNILTVKKGTPIEFLLHGEPDFVSFFSGEIGHQYIFRNRTELSPADIESCELKFSVWAQYGKASSCVNQFDVLYMAGSDAEAQRSGAIFPGLSKTDFEADSVLVEKNTPWKELVSREKLPQKPVSGASAANDYSFNLKSYIGQKMTLALVLNRDKSEAISANNPDDPKATIVQSTFHVQDMHIQTKWKNGRITKSYASAFGFTPLNMKNKTVFKDQDEVIMPADREYGSVTLGGVPGMWNLNNIANGNFTIQGCAVNEVWKYSWLVSDYLNLTECPEPDTSVKVKDITVDQNSYSYTYNQVGTYTATFVLNKANYHDAASTTRELIINVTE